MEYAGIRAGSSTLVQRHTHPADKLMQLLHTTVHNESRNVTSTTRRARSGFSNFLARILFFSCIASTVAGSSLPAQKRLSAGDVDTITLHGTSKHILYGQDMLNFGELRLPSGNGPFPLAIIVHGGCYLSLYASVRNTAALAEALTDAGIATWNVEYRRYDHAGGAWPGTFKDIADGTDYVRTLAKTNPIDTNRIIAMGHSAGGQLALWLASRSQLPRGTPLFAANPLGIKGVVALGPITDMKEYQTRERDVCGNPAIESVMGGMPDVVPERYQMVSPIQRVPIKVPAVLIAGDKDGIATRKSLDAYATAARAKGDSVRIITTADEGHFEAIAPTRAAGKAAIAAAKSLLGVKN